MFSYASCGHEIGGPSAAVIRAFVHKALVRSPLSSGSTRGQVGSRLRRRSCCGRYLLQALYAIRSERQLMSSWTTTCSSTGPSVVRSRVKALLSNEH